MSFTLRALMDAWRDEQVPFEFRGLATAGDRLRFSRLSFDSRDVDENTVFCAVRGERTHGREYIESAVARGVGALLVETENSGDANGLDERRPTLCVRDARQALAAAARGHLRASGAQVVAITGSNGKTTTKDFTRAALRNRFRVGASPGNLNSSWGLPAAVLASEEDLEVLVLEMGASGPGEIDALCDIAPPKVGVITNVAPAHLEFFGSEDEVARTKAAVVRRLVEGGTAVLPRDDCYYEFFVEQSGSAPKKSFGRSSSADIRVEDIELREGGLYLRVAGQSAELPVFSPVNAQNAAAAVAVADVLGVSVAEALESMESAELSPHRSRVLVRERGFVLDDSYNANPASMRAALEGLVARPTPGRRLAVLGRMAELGEAAVEAHRELLREAMDLEVDHVWVIGEEFARAAIEWDDPRLTVVDDLGELVSCVQSFAQPTDTWLVKGSRSVGLERIVESLTASSASTGEVA